MRVCPVRRLVDEDPIDGGGTLQARSSVDDVARGHPLACFGLGVEAHERLPGRDPDAQLESFFDGELADREGRADGALGVVLVGGGRAEERHHRIADELLDGAAVAFELRRDAFVVRPENRLHVLRVERLGARREADEVAEDDRDDLALAARAGHQAILASSASPRSTKRTAPTER